MTRARWARVGRGLGWPSMVIGAALALAMTLSGSAAPAAEAVRPPAIPSCGNAVGPFTVHGTKVLGAGGATFVSYGTTVSGLQNPNWEAYLNLDLQEIAATANDWCANTVRLQLSQDNLLGPNGQAYLNAIKAEVLTAESDNLVVVHNDSTEYTAPVYKAELGPTPATETFWKDLTKVYGQDPQVVFDLFNEPRMYYSGMSAALEWKLWLNGGNFLGANYPFGMAGLARYVRSTLRAKNLFWIEGPRFSFSFAGDAARESRAEGERGRVSTTTTSSSATNLVAQVSCLFSAAPRRGSLLRTRATPPSITGTPHLGPVYDTSAGGGLRAPPGGAGAATGTSSRCCCGPRSSTGGREASRCRCR